MPVMLKMSTHRLAKSLQPPHNTRLLRRPEDNNEISWPFAYLKHHLSDFIQMAFLDAQDVENELEWYFDTLKHRFIDFTKVVLKDVQKPDYVFPRPFAYLELQFREFFEIAFLNV
jgi:hypothetical protein